MLFRNRTTRQVISVLAIYGFIFSNFLLPLRMAYSEQIVTDGRTQTHLNINGNVTDITTSTIRGVNAYNSFTKFDVYSGNVANLHVPGSATNLLNLVHGQVSNIDGVLNAYKNGKIGGNVFFANPHGFVVGKGGVVNVGSLTVSTPTNSFMKGFFDEAGNPTDSATNHLLNGTAPISSSGLISIQGRVNALDKLSLQAADVSNSGVISAGVSAAQNIDFADLVNADNLQTGAAIVEKNGEIFIMAENDFTNSGQITVDGTADAAAGNIAIKAKRDITLAAGSSISAKGLGENSNGGNVVLFADNQSTLKNDASIDVSGGEVSGDGGFVEFSAKEKVVIEKGRADRLKASATQGDAGTILIDPNDFELVNSNIYTDGANFVLEANKSITVDDGFTISTRNLNDVNSDDHDTAVSKGNSGEITLLAPKISLDTGSKLFAHVIQDGGSNYSAGDISLNRDTVLTGQLTKAGVSSWLDGVLTKMFVNESVDTLGTFLQSFLNAPESEIKITGATIKGADVNIIASHADRFGFDKQSSASITITDSIIRGKNITIKAIADTSLLPTQVISAGSSSIDIESALGSAGLLGFGSTPYVSFSAAQTEVVVDGSSDINGTGNVKISSSSTSQAQQVSPGILVASVGFGISDAEAETKVDGTAKITAGSALELTAYTDNSSEVEASTNARNKPVAVTYAQVDAESVTKATTGANTTINAGTVKLSATGEGDHSLQASTIEKGASSAGLAFAISDIVSTTEASLGGNVTAGSTVDVNADFTYKNNITRADAASLGSTGSFSTKLENKIAGFKRQAGAKVLNQFTSKGSKIADFMFPGIKSGKLNLSGAVALNDTVTNVKASIANNAIVKSSGPLTIDANLVDNFNIGAISRSTSDGAAFGGSVGIGDYESNAYAWVGDNASVDTTGLIKVNSGVSKAYPWAIAWNDIETVLSHVTGNLENLLFDAYSFNSSKGKSGSLSASVSVVDYDVDSRAWLGKGAKINQTTGAGDINVLATNDLNFIQVAGSSVPFSFLSKLLKKTPSKGGFGGAAAFSSVNSDAKAWIDDGALVKANNLQLKAKSTERVVQLAKAGTKADKIGVSGTLTHSKLTGTVSAGIESGAKVTVANNLTIDADSEASDLMIAGAVAKGGNAGVGASISFSDVDTTTKAWIDDDNKDGTTTGFVNTTGNTRIEADYDGDISTYSVASSTASSTPTDASSAKDKGKGKFGLAVSGDVSFNNIVSNVSSHIGGGATVSSADLTLHALKDADIKAFSGTVAYASSTGKSAGLAGAYSHNTIGGLSQAYIKAAKVDASGLIRLEATTQGDMFTLSAGGSGASKGGIAVTGQVSFNQIANNTYSYIDTSLINKSNNNASGNVELDAKDKTQIFAIAGAVSFGGKAGVGAGIGINEIANNSAAYVKDSNVRSSGNLTQKAENDNTIKAISAALAASKNVAISGAISINEITSSAKAYLDNSGKADKSVDVALLNSIAATEKSKIEVISGAISASKSASLGASVSTNKISNSVESYVKNAVAYKPAGSTTLDATNASTIRSIAGSIGASTKVGAGVAVAVNRINNNTNAFVTGAASDIKNKNLLLRSTSEATIETISVALGASGKVGIGGSVSTNFINNNTQSYINDGAKIVAENNVGVLAESDDRITVAAGSAGVGISAAGVGASVLVNNIKGSTKAYIDGATTEVSAYAKNNADTLSVNSGALNSSVDLANGVDIDNYSKLDLKSKKLKSNVTGIAVNASATQHVESIGANISGGNNAAIGAVANVNVIGGTTEAYVIDATLNKVNTAGVTGQGINVVASNHAYGNGFVGNLSIAFKGAAAGAAADVHTFKRITRAYVKGSVLKSKGIVGVNALATQGASSIAVGGSAGAVGIAGTASFAQFVNTTEAYIDSSDVTATDVTVDANNENNMHLTGGAIAAGGIGVAATFTVGLNKSTTRASITATSPARSKITATGLVKVNAESTSNINQIAISGAGAGGTGFAGMAAVNVLTNTTEATISRTDIGTAGNRVGAVTVTANDTVNMDTKAGALALGGSSGIGAGAAVNILKSRSVSKVEDSTLYTSNKVEITADSQNNVDTIALTGGAGFSVGIGAAAVVTLVGSDVAGDSQKEVDKGGDGTLTKTNTLSTSDRLGDIGSGDDDVLTASERAQVSADSSQNVKDTATGADATFQYQTAATVSGAGTVIDAGTVDIKAKDKTSVDTTVGGLGIGSLGVGGGVAVVNVKANVTADVASGVQVRSQGNVNVTATAEKASGEVIDVLALAGAGGLVGLGAAVVVADVDNTVSAANRAETNAGTGTVTVEATDSSDINIDAKGAVVGAAAAGAVIARASKTSKVTALSAAPTVTARNAAVKAKSDGTIYASTQSAAGGLLGAGNGADAQATDDSTVTASTADASTFNVNAGNLTVEAEAKPRTEAKAEGVTVAGGLAVGVSIAKTKANARVSAALGRNNTINASSLTVAAKQTLNSHSAKSTAVAASGGYLAGIGATVGKAESIGVISSSVGENSTLNVTGTASVTADSNSKTNSTVTGITVGGIVAAGANISDANSDMQTTAALGDNVKVNSTTLNIKANGADKNYSQATSGSGGLVSGVATAADTHSKSVTKAETGSGSIAKGINVATLNLEAQHSTEFNGKINNLSASAVGASGAFSSHLVEPTVESNIADNAWILANKVNVTANNITRKPYLSGGAWNVNSGSGGLLLDVPGASSNSIIKHWTRANIGNTALVKTIAPVATPESVVINAFNDIQAFDKVKVNSGGAVAAPYGGSTVDVQVANADINFAANSAVISEKGDIKAGARAKVDLRTETVVDAYGIAGAPIGKAHSKYNGHNKVTLAAGTTNTTTIRTENGSVVLAAGENSSGATNDLDFNAKVNLWNKTAIPIPTPPDALTDVTNNNSLTINNQTLVESEKDIGLFANGGSVSSTAKGIGKDIYREALAAAASAVSNLFGGDDVSFEIRGGEEKVSGIATVSVLGSGKARTGIKRNKSLTLDTNIVSVSPSEVVWTLDATATDGVTYSVEFAKEIAANLKERIERLRKLQADYVGSSAEYQAYSAEIKFIEKKLVDLGLATAQNPGTLTGSGVSPRQSATNLLGQLQQDETAIITDRDANVVTRTGKNTDLQLFIDRDDKTTLRNIKAGQLATEQAKPAKDQNAALITQLTNEIGTLNGEIGTLTTSINNKSLVRATLETEITNLNTTIGEQNTQLTTLGGDIASLQTEIPTLSNTPTSGPSADFVTVNDINVRLGNLDIKADLLAGNGHLESPGDARIDITNNTPAFLKIKDLTIDSNFGGRITLNNFEVNSLAEINDINVLPLANFQTVLTKDSVGAPTLSVIIRSLYNPDDSKFVARGPAPDIELNGDIYNPRGLVRVYNEAGSILVGSGADIFAGTVEVLASNGDFVQSFSDNFFESGGDPAAVHGGSTPGGIVANGSVFIASRFLNINGLIQSGIERWAVTLPTTPTMTGSARELGVAQSDIDTARTTYSNDKTKTSFTFTNDRGQSVAYNAVEDRLEVNLAFVTADAQSTQGKARNPTGLYSIILPKDTIDENFVGTIGANYDAINDRYELNGIEVKGGYIQLYGQIINTSNTQTGTLKVLDGYGTINVNNPTSRDVVINKLDTGRGVAGVIDITDIQYLDGNSNPVSINTLLTRENGVVKVTRKGRWNLNGSGLPASFDANYSFSGVDASAVNGRQTAYNPQPGQRFVWTTGKDRSTITYYKYTATQFLGISDLQAFTNTSNRVAGPRTLRSFRLDDGNYLLRNQSLAKPHYESTTNTVSNGTPTQVITHQSSNCNWWSACITQKVRVEWNVTTPTKDITRNSVKADYPIKILFSGQDSGSINVISSAGGDILLKNRISDLAGITTITSTNASILQHDESAVIKSKTLNLNAINGHVGSAATPIQIIQNGNNALLNASSSTGNISVHNGIGDFMLGNITASQGLVKLSSDGNIVHANPANKIIGRRVDLTSNNGQIGSDAQALLIETGYTNDLGRRGEYGLKASARENINIKSVANGASADNANGDLLVDRVVSATGDVKLQTDGKIIDNNLEEEIDQRTWNELLTYWDDLQLRKGTASNTDKQANEIKVFEETKTDRYRRYWEARQQQADASVYDANFNYVASSNERTALTARFTQSGVAAGDVPAKITEYEGQRTTEYHALHPEVGGLNGGAFSSSYRYASTSAEQAKFLKGSSWTDRELGITVSSGLKEITDTNPVVKEANIVGRNVTLISGDDIGHTAGATDISTSITPDLLTPAQKVALAAAERADLTSPNSNTIRVLLRKAVNVDVASNGSLIASSQGNTYLGSEQSLRLNTVDAVNDIRIKVGKSLLNANLQAAPNNYNIQGGSTILEAAKGAIGELNNPITLKLNNAATLTARAFENIYLQELAGNINVDTIYTPKQLTLKTAGSILDAFNTGPEKDELNIRSASFFPVVGGSIGAASNPLEVEVDATGKIDANVPGDVYLSSPLGALTIGDLTVGGDVELTAGSNGIKVNKLTNSTGSIDLKADGNIHVTNLESSSSSAKVNDVISSKGSVDLGITGSASIANILAALGAKVVASGDSLTINKSVSDSLTLGVQAEGGSLDVTDATVSSRLAVMADNVDMPAVLHSPALAPLRVSATGNDDGIAESININITSSIGVFFEKYKAKRFNMTFTNDNVNLTNVIVGDVARISTPKHNIYVDNINRRLDPAATAQLYAPGIPFALRLTNENLLFTDALLVNYKPRFIVNAFSTENSLLRLASKRLATQEKRIERLFRVFAPSGMSKLPRPAPNDVEFDEDALNLGKEDADEEEFLKVSGL